ncbi:MAG: TonB-dependent receptor [Porphyromonas sp.]|nr:TonB-dependent receptor [Porphyromonas sp.]
MHTIRGKVVDASGWEVIGATIKIEDRSGGTATNLDGEFEIKAAIGDILECSYVGFASQRIKITSADTPLNIVMQEDADLLDEVVVVGYGVMRKSDVTGAITTVDGGDLTKRATTNPAEALQGKVAGVNIMKSGGNAGSGVSVKIRGVNTFGDNEPLYIIDGFPGNINSINPQDIASLEILKDGAAAAIYGSVAANGVVLITTKSGIEDEIKVEFSSYLSAQKVAKRLEFLNAEEYKQIHKSMYDNFNAHVSSGEQIALPTYITHNTGVDTDWQDAMLRNGLSQNYMVGIRGGGSKGKYTISYNRSDDKGIFLGNNYRHDLARTKLNLKKGIVSMDANLSFKYTASRQPRYSLKEMYMISPLVPIYDETQESGYGLTNFDGLPNNRNVMADNDYRKRLNQKYNTNANVGLTFDLYDGLTFRTSYGYRGEHEKQSDHVAPYVADIRSKQQYTEHTEFSGYWEEQIFDNVLNYNSPTGSDHSFGAMLGTSLTNEKYKWSSVSVEGKSITYSVDEHGNLVTTEVPAGFLDPSFDTINAGEGGTYSGEGTRVDYRRFSIFGRLNYSYQSKYMAQLTLRRDGSSKFGADSRWGYFPSVALGWRISQEDFFPEDGTISDLKLRASWGRLGNEVALGKYDFVSLISTGNTKWQGYVTGKGENPWPGSISRDLENRGLKWETSDNKNIGLDFGFFRNRLSGSVNYYNNETRDLLITKVLPPSAGLNNPTLNVGRIRNSGMELELNWNDEYQGLTYNVGLNVSTLKNRVLDLSDEGQAIYGEGLKYGTEHFPTQTRIGAPIGAYYLYRTDGIFQSEEEVMAHKGEDGALLQRNAKPGDIRFVDVNGDGVLNDQDKEYCGSGMPKVEANLSFGANYKGIDLSLLLSGAFGHKLYNGNRYFYEGMNSGSNFLKSTLEAWTPNNRDTSVPRAVFSDPNGNMLESDRFLESGDFVRLRQVQIGYALPKSLLERIQIDNLRFYISGENLLTITKYSGIDPEFSRGSVLNTGIDNLIYPFTRSYTVGLQLTF